MRWPLRYQILLPMALLMVAALVGVSFLNSYLSVVHAQARIDAKLKEVAETLSNASFPLTDAVLLQAHGLSGAEFSVADASGKMVATSNRQLLETTPHVSELSEEQSVLGKTYQIKGVPYFIASNQISWRQRDSQQDTLYIYYPVESYRNELRAAMFPPILVGVLALVMTILLAVFISRQVTFPLDKLKRQVNQIAEGNFQPMPLSDRNDEILDLRQSVNRMAHLLNDYEQDVRKNERLRLLGQVSGSMAHQLRNAATGCRMALELHQEDCPLSGEDESLEVALRQLVLIEQYVSHFFSRTRKAEVAEQHQAVNLVEIVNNVLSLLRPGAEHVRVGLEFSPPQPEVLVKGDATNLEQMVINLLQNAIDAASMVTEKRDSAESQTGDPLAGNVEIKIRTAGDAQIFLEVIDSGPGPESEVTQTMFDPLVTGKVDGTGLGLSVAQAIAEDHNTMIRWKQLENSTCFYVSFSQIDRSTNA